MTQPIFKSPLFWTAIIATMIYIFHPIVILIFIAFMIANSLRPLINWVEDKGIPRWVGIASIYLGMILLVAGLSALIFPTLIRQGNDFIQSFPNTLNQVSEQISNTVGLPEFRIENTFQDLNIVDILSQSIFTITSEAISIAFQAFSLLVITFYLLLQPDALKDFFLSFTPSKHQSRAKDIWSKVESKLGDWVRGELILISMIGVYIYAVLLATGLGEYALIIAVISALLEIIPLVGSTVSVILGSLVAFEQSPLMAAFVAVLLIIGQQIQSQIVLPRVMTHNVGLNPLIILVAILMGGHILGSVGALISVPIAAVGSIIYDEWKSSSAKNTPKKST